MMTKSFVSRVLRSISAALLLGAALDACASVGHTWKEEALLHDGTKIIVERTVERGGRHEIGQQPPIKQQSLTFVLPNHNTVVTWHDAFTPDIGGANFLPMQLEVRGDAAYLVAHPMGCLSYNKWGRPNPPYVIFKYQANAWQRIPLQDLPVEFTSPNLLFSSPDEEAKKTGQRIVSAQTIKRLYAGYRQPEYRSILRERLPIKDINEMCEERVLYKGYWVLPNDPVARKLIDQKKQ
jgi:hypothetical protein